MVAAAIAGDQRAMDALVAACLPLVYNIVGRAMAGHADVDDVVQETMLHVVRGLPGLRDPERFRSWLVAIAIQEVRGQWRGRDRTVSRERLDPDVTDPGADFVDLTITRLGLQGQRREVAEATRWLDPADRQLLALWWLEAAGELTRADLAGALRLTPPHATVRVQRMKAQLDAARAVVRALWTSPRCPRLAGLAQGWDGHPASLWRKRFARHTRECDACAGAWSSLVPADRLLVGLALVPLPLGYALPALQGGAAGVAGAGHASGAGHSAGWFTKLSSALTGKPAAAVATALVLGGGAVAVNSLRPTELTPSSAAPTGLTASPTPSDSPTPTLTATPTPSPSPTFSATPEVAGPVYGSVVDQADAAPPKLRRPDELPRRPTSDPITAIDGKYQDPRPGFIGGQYVMMYRGDFVTLKGQGYFQVRYEIAFFNRPGSMMMPTWTGLKGKLFHVASGGLRRMDDPKPNDPPDTDTWMGTPEQGYVVLPDGAQQMWQNEFFYLDGEVTLNNNERGADYNITATPKTWDAVVADLTAPPPADPEAKGWVRYGLVRDTGDDGAPVPQYCTREVPTIRWEVAQVSQLR